MKMFSKDTIEMRKRATMVLVPHFFLEIENKNEFLFYVRKERNALDLYKFSKDEHRRNTVIH